jgi:hypothetical protein
MANQLPNYVRTTFQEVYFDLCDVAFNEVLAPEYKGWKDFYATQRDKLASIEEAIFGKEEHA